MNAPESKMLVLAERLLERTLTGAQRWEETDRSTVFATVVGDASLLVSRNEVADSWSLVVENAVGQTLERADVMPGSSFTSSAAENRMTDAVIQLYETVRRKVLQVDETLDRILNDL